MKQTTFMEIYPIREIDIKKTQTRFNTVDEIIAYLKTKIDEHKVATYIATFDHYAHTASLDEGTISPEILDAKNIIFCFGKELPKAQVLAVRPRSIGVAERSEDFVLSFLVAPNPTANTTMIEWCKSIANL
ncbi:MAG TPA: hypothetical protein PLH07_07170 [Sulfurovum sp.]|nr:MAG: hypothetical protein B7Y63_07020 [Sulfurovum sp. 35-42-20]OYZ26167.1 MAG: hypothetical protein B7Y23_02970 [Sulfurovum sp. 16-42-52]OZA46205.1 MAG: hypothetical protein B7X80_03400 [Sulfurovum sp. 17-42-90]OZA60755.1 MAG: hypothetical protein B7X69_02685 [Sulfurovum sp. 39-42-12]HQR74517.1 hypothetical protein [Sulfurovum sp.]